MAKKEIVKKDVAVKAASKVAKKDVAKKETAKKETATPVEKKAPSTILTATDISEHLATTFEIPKSHAKAYLAESIEMIGKHLKKGTKVRLSGLGIFQVKKRAARKGRNPNTGDAIKIKASKRVAFAASRDLKAKL
ncbi:HU family DNA-binding protein [Beijerinckia sp. L45]|uniref:HU family DNA-binding protein n=1 Tax=Beijerinckia sp. L45 TaxID=1641855 RepID=UPI001FEE9670|nr:HU family DNA-binding protein [Beijerinckia sp. L45]